MISLCSTLANNSPGVYYATLDRRYHKITVHFLGGNWDSIIQYIFIQQISLGLCMPALFLRRWRQNGKVLNRVDEVSSLKELAC